MEPEQPNPAPGAYVRARPEDVQTSCDTKHWTELVQDPMPKLEYERYLREHPIGVDDVEQVRAGGPASDKAPVKP